MELAGFGRRLARNLEGEQGPTQTIAVEDHRHADVGCRPGDQIVIQGTVSRNAPRIAQRSPATDGGADHVLRRHPLDPVDGMLVALRLDGQPETRFRRVDGRRQGRWQLRVEATGAVETIDPDRPIEVLGTVLTIIRRPRARSTLPIAQRESTMT